MDGPTSIAQVRSDWDQDDYLILNHFLGELAANTRQIQKLKKEEAKLVKEARKAEATWAEIAEALDRFPQAVHKSYRDI
jgi:hypothetical protein